MALHVTRVSAVSQGAWRTFGQRAQAAVLSVALGLSATLPPAAAVAQEADQEREGVANPEQTAPSPDTVADPDFDPGGETELPFEAGTPDDGGDDDDAGDGAPVDLEPVTDPDALAVPLDDPAAMAPEARDGVDEPAAPAEPAPPTPLPAPAPPPTPLPPAATTPPTTGDQQAAGDRRQAARDKRSAMRKRQRERARQRPAIRVTIPAPPAVAPAPVAPAPVTATAAEPVEAATTKPRARASEDTYTVQPGDHLWEIASDLLGPGATDAEIVAESNRVYGLNPDVIGDDPNLLIPGTVLRLR
jgi:LysM repeat protein